MPSRRESAPIKIEDRSPMLSDQQETSMPHISEAADIASSASKLAFFSPHYDDAVFSCGGLLAAARNGTVVTVYTGLPGDGDILTDWDQRCGFASAGEAMQARAIENKQALTLLHATGIDLQFLDSQYARQLDNGKELLSDALASTIAHVQPTHVFFPLGLFHEDHITVSDVMLTLCHQFPTMHWFAYEDIPYRKRAEHVSQRLSELSAQGVLASRFPITGKSDDKAEAVSAYQSQFQGLGYEDAKPLLQLPEQYWHLRSNMELL